jgi:hypothetical protein
MLHIFEISVDDDDDDDDNDEDVEEEEEWHYRLDGCKPSLIRLHSIFERCYYTE